MHLPLLLLFITLGTVYSASSTPADVSDDPVPNVQESMTPVRARRGYVSGWGGWNRGWSGTWGGGQPWTGWGKGWSGGSRPWGGWTSGWSSGGSPWGGWGSYVVG
ncbi:hypothetical protein GCK32_013483 [Trichostrongylus colubriformis]|uniref:Uncharacterized protein n=1 Tax=Trichostrongylus colubriformis TaxID=6319 RepID=A0AAN8GEX5_TRICO